MPAGGLDILLKAERGEVDPLTITADQYDLVCNGVELSSGAVRNHDPEIMIKAFEMVRLGEEDVKKKFPAMYNAFCYGAPPHAGIAPGVDRMVMLLAGEDSIREVIPFPMNKNAQDILMGAPSEVTQKQLDELHIAVVGETPRLRVFNRIQFPITALFDNLVIIQSWPYSMAKTSVLCHCEPVTDVTGVAIRPPEAVTNSRTQIGRWELRIATPACALVRNDKLERFFHYLTFPSER